MKAERWARINEVFHAALEREPDRRAAFIDQACGGDQTLLKEVESLIMSHEQGESFIESPAADLAAELFASDQDKLVGWSIGPYRIVELLGVGGMGEVYLAEDTRLGRRVAVKVLPAKATQDEERLTRFEREARAASALNHPNIITIHEIGQADGSHFIVTEFVEGQTLRQQMSRGRMKMDEALDVAIQAASALEAAHKAGIVHRDIKPENIMLRGDGLIKLLDFGLAKLTETRPADAEAASRARFQTRTGVVMGTVTYMSPEQARGLAVDSRTDIFSLGAVIYEMLAGRVPFEGETTSDVIVSILEKEPQPLSRCEPVAHVELERIVAKALAKDRDERYQLAKDLLIDLKNLKQETELQARLSAARRANLKGAALAANELRLSVETDEQLTIRTGDAAPARTKSDLDYVTGAIRRHKRGAVLLIAAITLVMLAAAFGFYSLIAARGSKTVLPFQMMKMTRVADAGNATAVISPDQKYIAYMMYGTATDGLWLRQTATESAIRLLPLVACWGLSFSKDSNYVYCSVGGADHPEGALYKVPALGGSAKLVLEGITGGASFSPDGDRMVFKRKSKETGRSILVTANADGTDERIILPGNSRYTIWAYDWSPDGKSIAFSVRNDTAPSTSQVLVIPAVGGEERPVLPPQREAITAIAWVPDGSGLIMIAVDKTTALHQLWHLSYPSGQATRITNDSSWYTGISITSKGDAILATRNTGPGRSIWIGDAGDLNGLRKTLVQGDCLKWTPDGRVLYSEDEDGKHDLWIMKADTTERQRLTNDQSQNDWPVMTLDGRYIVFSSWRSGSRQIWRMDSDGRNLRQLTVGSNECWSPKITPDGHWVVYSTEIPPSGWSVKKIPVDGGESVTLADGASEFAISPDGKLLAYQSSDERTKRTVIVVKPMDRGEPIKTFNFPDLPVFRIEQWTHEGLFCISADSTRTILVPVDGNQPREYFKTSDRIFSFAFSLDGTRVAFSLGVSAQEAVMITNLKDR